MENASKALIIAGAILLAILLISLGIMVYNQAKDTVDDADLSTQEVQTFNAQFTPYLGDNVSASKANALIDAAKADGTVTVTLSSTNVSGGRCVSGKTYKITPTYDTAGSGKITAITIADPTTTP